MFRCFIAITSLLLCFGDIAKCADVPDELFGYVETDPGGFMFYWFYGSTNPNVPRDELPLILWLAGGPGVGGSGYGNFGEFGPYNQWLEPRNNSWITKVNILFIDAPYGAGYSYVTNDTLYATTKRQVSNTLVKMHKQLIESDRFNCDWFCKLDYYIFGESYGGPFGFDFAYVLDNEINKNKDVNFSMNLKGVLSCDGWIHPISYMYSYPIFLYTNSLINSQQMLFLNNITNNCNNSINNNNYSMAIEYRELMMEYIEKFTINVDYYDYLEFDIKSEIEIPLNDTQIDKIMNGVIKYDYLNNTIPDNVRWDGNESNILYNALRLDFMNDTIFAVNYLLENDFSVNVWNGNLDLIVNNLGTLHWIENYINWTYLDNWKFDAEREAFLTNDNKSVNYFAQKYKNFAYYWVLGSGHEAPAYNYDAATKIMCTIVDVDCWDM